MIFQDTARTFIRSRASANTRASYQADLNAWVEFCDAQGVNPAKVPTDAAVAYREALMKRYAPASAAKKLAVLSSIYRYCLEQEIPAASWNPFSTRALPRPPAPRFGKTRAVKDADAQAMIAAADTRDAALLSVLYATGLRRVSVARLRRADIYRREDGTLVSRATIKGGEEVEVEIPEPAAGMLLQWLRASGSVGPFVFPGRAEGQPIGLSTVNKIIVACAKAVGLKGIHPHQFRVSFVTGLYDAGAAERDIQAAAHHKDPRSTQRYDRGRRGSGAAALLAKFREQRVTDTASPTVSTPDGRGQERT